MAVTRIWDADAGAWIIVGAGGGVVAVADSIRMGGTISNSTVSIGAEAARASITFTKPAAWNTYEIMAWSQSFMYIAGVTDSTYANVRVAIGGNNGAYAQFMDFTVYTEKTVSIGAMHQVAGLTAASTVIEVKTSSQGGSHRWSDMLQYIAMRTS